MLKPLFGFVTSSEGLFQEENELQKVHVSDGFDPNALLMKKSGSDFNIPSSLGHVIEAKPYRLNDTKKNDTKIG